MQYTIGQCEVCGKEPRKDGITVYRVNLGETPSRWRCFEHLESWHKAAMGPEVFCVANTLLSMEDMVALIRAFLTTTPLVENDVRLDLIEDIRSSIIREETKTKRRWVMLNPFRNIALKRTHRRE